MKSVNLNLNLESVKFSFGVSKSLTDFILDGQLPCAIQSMHLVTLIILSVQLTEMLYPFSIFIVIASHLYSA